MRESLWDKARGIGIILVVYGHVLRGLSSAGLVPVVDPLMFSDFAIYTFHMPLFFLLAGVNAARGVGRDDFLKSKLWTIVYPYFLWSLLQGLLQMKMGGSLNHEITWAALVAIPWTPLFHFWFLSALFICHILARLTRSEPLWLVLLVLCGYPLATYFLKPVPLVANPLGMLIYYAAGLFLHAHLRGIVARLSQPLVLLVTAAGLGVAIYVSKQLGGFGTPTVVYAAFLGILLVLLLAQQLPDKGLWRVFELLGLASMPIYLVHVFATAGTRMVLNKLHVDSVAIHLVVGTLAGLALPLIMFYCVYLARQERWFGFGSGETLFGRRPREAKIVKQP